MASYKAALDWIAEQDDTEWIGDYEVKEYNGDGTWDEPVMSVTATLVADLWKKTPQQLITDLKKALRRVRGTR